MWSAEKPSNIALIKYMGKSDVNKNRPTNASLSWTLDHLVTRVEISKTKTGEDVWEPLPSDYPFSMSDTGRTKYLNHLKRIKEYFGVEGSFLVRSANNFPADCGIASSASSFAALTEAACLAFSELTGKSVNTVEKAKLSALGSGSSCRSFMSGWVHWDCDQIHPVETEANGLLHMVVIVGDQAKKVSSSEAHKIVPSSPLFEGRVKRAEDRLQQFIESSQALNWNELYKLSWDEFRDMHDLFETSNPSFSYFLPGTEEVLQGIQSFWQEHQDGPLVTMDAGPNVHLLWREDQKDLAQSLFKSQLQNKWTCLSNIEGIGFAKH